MISPLIATITLFGFRLRSFEEMADRLVAGDTNAWVLAAAVAAVVCILIVHRSSRR